MIDKIHNNLHNMPNNTVSLQHRHGVCPEEYLINNPAKWHKINFIHYDSIRY
ncbi:MAG: hypothetical protein LBR10_02745 [Prevotellaceae bacterium]|jgi:hypothetical protein|nr:hypothetical protein [Prevotellaceae bacterium]